MCACLERKWINGEPSWTGSKLSPKTRCELDLSSRAVSWSWPSLGIGQKPLRFWLPALGTPCLPAVITADMPGPWGGRSARHSVSAEVEGGPAGPRREEGPRGHSVLSCGPAVWPGQAAPHGPGVPTCTASRFTQLSVLENACSCVTDATRFISAQLGTVSWKSEGV